MRSGRLRHRIDFQTKTPALDAYGGQVDTWEDTFRGIPASIDPLSGRELLAAQAVQNESRFKITTRYFTGFEKLVVPSMRIVFGTRTFNITDATNIEERNKELQFICSEGLAKG